MQKILESKKLSHHFFSFVKRSFSYRKAAIENAISSYKALNYLRGKEALNFLRNSEMNKIQFLKIPGNVLSANRLQVDRFFLDKNNCLSFFINKKRMNILNHMADLIGKPGLEDKAITAEKTPPKLQEPAIGSTKTLEQARLEDKVIGDQEHKKIETKDVLRDKKYWQAPSQRPIFLKGPRGVGKSHLLALLVLSLRSLEKTRILYFNNPNLYSYSFKVGFANELAYFVAPDLASNEKIQKKFLSIDFNQNISIIDFMRKC